jgi:hypothetical protein
MASDTPRNVIGFSISTSLRLETVTTPGSQRCASIRLTHLGLLRAERTVGSPIALAARSVLHNARHSRDPEFSWKWELAPAGIGFVSGSGLGPSFEGDLFMGAATPLLEGGYLFHFNITGDRAKVGVDDPGLQDRVADNLAKHEITESESLLIGTDFGIATDIETGPNGNLFVVSLSNGAVYEIFRR